MAPPRFERIPRMFKIRNGEWNFVTHIIKISGGIIPRKDSEMKKIIRTDASDKFSVVVLKMLSKSVRCLAFRINGITIIVSYSEVRFFVYVINIL